MAKPEIKRKKKPKVKESNEKREDTSVISKPKKEANDTIFIRNLSFDTEEDDLKKFVEDNFGQTVYCLICRDKETDESKGTAFAKFKDPEDYVKCLKDFKDKDSQTKFHIDGRNLMIFPALSRDKIEETKLKSEKKDKRNLALAKEGYIHPKSDEAEELSKNDLEKRKTLDMRKRELIKNLHNFVSDTRLCIHNLPASMDDQRLKNIFYDNLKIDFPAMKIIECRVMRNKKGSGQLGASKGFGFVAFSKHEHALGALRKLNNNPSVFSRDKRPIVEFSIENLVALNKKKTRLVNSQRKNMAIQPKKSPLPSGEKQNDLPKKTKKIKKKFKSKRAKV